MIKWTGLAPWEFEFPFPGSLTSTFLRPGFWGCGFRVSSAASLGVALYSSVDMLDLRYESINFGADQSLGLPNWWAQRHLDRGNLWPRTRLFLQVCFLELSLDLRARYLL